MIVPRASLALRPSFSPTNQAHTTAAFLFTCDNPRETASLDDDKSSPPHYRLGFLRRPQKTSQTLLWNIFVDSSPHVLPPPYVHVLYVCVHAVRCLRVRFVGRPKDLEDAEASLREGTSRLGAEAVRRVWPPVQTRDLARAVCACQNP